VIHDKVPALRSVREKVTATEDADSYFKKLESLTKLPAPDAKRYLLTVTELATFDKCPRMYAYRSVWHVPPAKNGLGILDYPDLRPQPESDDEDFLQEGVEQSENFELPVSEWGNLAHMLLEMTSFDSSEKEIEGKAEKLLAMHDLDPGNYLQRLKAMISETYRLPIFNVLKTAKEIHKELRLLGKFRDTDDIVLGIIDLFAEVDDRLIIIDFKSGRVDKQSADDKARRLYSLQLATYAHLASEYKNIPLDKIDTMIIFLQPPVESILSLSKENLANPLNVLRTLNKCSSENDFPPDPGTEKCGWCDYRDICRYFVSPA
jgi:CRISPR/Cas system-associated exonuclease Cas4 (RecB family)